VCDRQVAALRRHINRYINEDYDVETASDMKAAIDLHGGVKGCNSAFSKHDQALAEWRPLKAERSSLGGPTISDPERYSPQCPGCVSEPCKAQRTYKFTSKLEQQPTALTMEPIAAEGIQHHEESVVFGCPVEGCIE
ncbi:unnamed protein product, partial [Pocillopora meandrina]